MSGHGHVTPNASGMLARCGGPAICPECAAEAQAARPDPAGHVLTVRSYWHNDGGSSFDLTCACGQFEKDFAGDGYGDDSGATLAELNEAAAEHLASRGACTHGLGKDGERLNVLTGGSAVCPSCGPASA